MAKETAVKDYELDGVFISRKGRKFSVAHNLDRPIKFEANLKRLGAEPHLIFQDFVKSKMMNGFNLSEEQAAIHPDLQPTVHISVWNMTPVSELPDGLEKTILLNKQGPTGFKATLRVALEIPIA